MIVTRGYGLGPYASIVAAGMGAMVTALERVAKAAGFVLTKATDLYVSLKPTDLTVNKRVR